MYCWRPDKLYPDQDGIFVAKKLLGMLYQNLPNYTHTVEVTFSKFSFFANIFQSYDSEDLQMVFLLCYVIRCK